MPAPTKSRGAVTQIVQIYFPYPDVYNSTQVYKCKFCDIKKKYDL